MRLHGRVTLERSAQTINIPKRGRRATNPRGSSITDAKRTNANDTILSRRSSCSFAFLCSLIDPSRSASDRWSWEITDYICSRYIGNRYACASRSARSRRVSILWGFRRQRNSAIRYMCQPANKRQPRIPVRTEDASGTQRQSPSQNSVKGQETCGASHFSSNDNGRRFDPLRGLVVPCSRYSLLVTSFILSRLTLLRKRPVFAPRTAHLALNLALLALRWSSPVFVRA